MKTIRRLDRNQLVVACLFGICVLLIFLIFFISNHTAETKGNASSQVTSADVEEAYAFLAQDEAVKRVLSDVSSEDLFTYADYREFLEQLHLWEAADFEQLPGWDTSGKEGMSLAMLWQSRDLVEELFEMTAEEQEDTTKEESAEANKKPAAMPAVDEHTKVRVLLLQDKKPLREEVYVSANQPYEITWKEHTKTKKKDQMIRAGQLKLDIGEAAEISSKKGDVYLTDEKGTRASLGYRGSFWITRYADGYALVNEVEIEDYLYGVVQSEMPAYFETEALKAQAVCARTYIVSQLMQENYPDYHADVDDSVNFQVYNQASPDERVVKAVNATKGLILEADGLPVNAYFFSTSHGMTSGREIWGLSDLPYLQPVRGNVQVEPVDLSKEENFRTYIRETDKDDYDASGSYYRWKAVLDITTRLNDVKTLLCRIEGSQPDHVTITNNDGQRIRAAEISDWKNAQQLKVLERSSSGAVTCLQIVFSEGRVEITNESYIRQVLGLWIRTMQDKDGSFVNAGEMLPSVYFYIQPVKEGIVLFGGGYGHGIGMSQYGADGMAKTGADMKDILHFYYQDVELIQLYANET